jgi:ClpP class serine protease
MAAWSEMSPTAMMMIHCTSTGAEGNHNDFEKTAEVLRTADDALANAYTAKTGMSKEEAIQMMEETTWMTAEQALEKGLIDKIMFEEEKEEQPITDGPMFKLPTEEQMAQVKALIEGKEEKVKTAEMKTKLNLLRLTYRKNRN